MVRRLNAAANNVNFNVDATDQTAAAPVEQRYDVILLADVFYEAALAAGAMVWATAARSLGTRVLVGDPRRSYFPTERFAKLADYAVPVTRELEDSEIKNGAVWELLA